MADKTCKYCSMIIPVSAKICPHCRKNVGFYLTWPAKIFLVLVGFSLVSIIGSMMSSKSNQTSSTGQTVTQPAKVSSEYNEASLTKNIDILTNKIKLIKRMKINLGKAWVDPVLWYAANAEIKENIAMNIAFYCGWKGGSGGNRSEIYDNQSGKLLAEYSELWGFKVK